MAFDLDNLLPFLRQAINDRDSEDYEYPDDELRNSLRFGATTVESGWDLEHTITSSTVGEGENAQTHFFVTPDPEPYLQMLYVLKTALMMKTFEEKHSYKVASISVTRTSKKEDMDALQKLYDDIEYEHRYKDVGFVYNTWDDYFTRWNLIWNELTIGYR